MKERTYIAPKTIMLEMEAVAQVMAGSEQGPDADGGVVVPSKRSTTVYNGEGDWHEDDPWETLAKHKNLWD